MLGRFPWRREWLPTPVFLPEEFHGWRSLMGPSPWGHKESDTTEQLTFLDFPASSDGKESACNAGDLGSISGSGRFPGEGSGYALQYSCLKNPMDRGAWRAIGGLQRVKHAWAHTQSSYISWLLFKAVPQGHLRGCLPSLWFSIFRLCFSLFFSPEVHRVTFEARLSHLSLNSGLPGGTWNPTEVLEKQKEELRVNGTHPLR